MALFEVSGLVDLESKQMFVLYANFCYMYNMHEFTKKKYLYHLSSTQSTSSAWFATRRRSVSGVQNFIIM